MRNELSHTRPYFTGHETFTLRHGWLKKAYDAAKDAEVDGRSVFLQDDAVARFGVGKNMVSSIRHWTTAAGVIEPSESKEVVTDLGKFLFDEKIGEDPYMEHPSTLWAIHWNLSSSRCQKTTWFWAFNLFHEISFERGAFEIGLQKYAEDCGWPRVAPSTIKRDVACFIRTYAPLPPAKKSTYEDSMESPLIELGLIRQEDGRDRFRFLRGPKRSLGVGVFGYALAKFWDARHPDISSLTFDALMHEPGSPGRIFLLDENSLFNLCGQMEEASDGQYRWSETAGLRQLVRTRKADEEAALALLNKDYR